MHSIRISKDKKKSKLRSHNRRKTRQRSKLESGLSKSAITDQDKITCMHFQSSQFGSTKKRYVRCTLTIEDRYQLLKTYYEDLKGLRPKNKDISTLRQYGKRMPTTKQGMNGLVLREASSCPDGLQISAWRTDKISKCIGIDSTELSIEKTTYYLWMAVDLVNREPIAYEITEKKDEATVLEFLFKIKLMLQHEPDFVVTDMDPTLLSCVRLVFPNTIHQGCTFHRAKDNNDFMPTSLEYSHPTFRPFKILCKKIVAAKTIPHQAKYLKRMILEEKKWKSDLRTGKAYDSLMHHIHYYNTAEELGQCPFTNNLTERLIKLVKDLHNDMNGFKTLAAARAHIKGYWWYRRYTEKQGDGHSKKKKTPTSGRFLELIRHAGRMSHYRKWFREIEMKNSDAIATLLYDTNESFTTNEIAIMLTKVWKSIDVRNISREVTSEGKDLLPYVRKEDDSNRIYLTASGREWYAKILLPRLL